MSPDLKQTSMLYLHAIKKDFTWYLFFGDKRPLIDDFDSSMSKRI